MFQSLWKYLNFAPALAWTILLSGNPALAGEIPGTVTEKGISPASTLEQIRQYRISQTPNGKTREQVTSVSQLSDVQPTDWAYQALQSLVERYGCIAGYPNATFQGNRALTRYEFAAGLNACLDRVNELIASATADLATKADLATLQKFQEEFAAELATLRGRVDALEARTNTLEKQQFSTTTKLSGEAIFGVSGATGTGASPDPTVFQERVRLNFDTSFTGKDLLRTRLQAGNSLILLFRAQPSGTRSAQGNLALNEGRFTYDGRPNTTDNSVALDLLSYSFPIGDSAKVHLFANRGTHFQYADTVNPFLEDKDGGNGSLSRFGQRNPIYNMDANGTDGSSGAGIGLNYKFGNALRLDLGYIANEANDPSTGGGFFNGNYSALAQIVAQPIRGLKLGFTYVNGYDNIDPPQLRANVGSGSRLGNLFSGSLRLQPAIAPFYPGTRDYPIVSNSYGFQASYQISPSLVVGGWVGLTKARLIGFADAEIWNYALTLAFPDLGSKGSLGGIIVGSEPTLKGLSRGGSQLALLDKEDALHIEGFYRYRLSDNISITPGAIWLPNPNQSKDTDDIFIYTLRTTFTF